MFYMDIQYLLWLQDFRNSINDAWTPFLEWVSLFAVTYLVMIPVFIYWALDKRKGLYTLATYYAAVTVNAAIKLTACVYRPWIRDSRILPAGDAITTATGYSFPSGHTMTATPIYGGLAIGAWKKWKWVSAICIAMILLMGFSRNYLGVHTPQDVLVGLAVSALMLFLMNKLFGWCEANPEKEKWVLLAGFLFGCAVIAYITFKPYPMDYVDGKLLVDPQRMMNDGYGDPAMLIAFCAARAVERKWVRFKPTGLNAKGIAICVVGLAGLWCMISYQRAALDAMLGSHWGHFFHNFIVVFYCIAIFPLVIRLVGGQRTEEEKA